MHQNLNVFLIFKRYFQLAQLVSKALLSLKVKRD